MIISNYKDSYVKIESTYLQQLISTPGLFSSVEINGNVNCCVDNCDELISSETILSPNTSGWKADITTVANLGNDIQELFLYNLVTGTKYNVLGSSVAYNNPSAIQTAINSWFTSIGLSGAATVTLSSNILTISNLPSYFTVFSLSYGVAAPYTEIMFGFGEANSKAFIAADGLYILPSFFGWTSLTDSVLSFEVKYIKPSNTGFILESNCAFIDKGFKCKVASKLNLLKEEANNNSEQTSTIMHLLHYGLVNGSNCGCNCADLCTIYKELYSLVSDINLENTDCGC